MATDESFAEIKADSVSAEQSTELNQTSVGPAQTAPSQTAPSQTAPSQTPPSQTAPSQTAPSQTPPSQSAEVEVEVGAAGGIDAEEQKVTKASSAEDSSSGIDALRPFIIISITYLLFTTTDGAVRMLVLLHAYSKGFSAMQVAIVFSLYELVGAVTNLVAGVAGAKWGIRATLVSGLLLQIGGLGMLFAWEDDWDKVTAIVYVTAAQALCGIAKDLTKLGGKTITKLVTPEEKQDTLFKLVSFITGYKNSFKGVGYFMGAALLDVSYELALFVNIGFIVVALPFAVFGLSSQLGQVRSKNINFASIFNQNTNVNYLSLARMFLFGSRDLWFEVPLPFYLRSPAGLGWPRSAVGATLGIYIILYGQIQSYTPQLVLQPLKQSPPNKFVCMLWNALLATPVIYMFVMMLLPEYDTDAGEDPSTAKVVTLMIGIFSFAFVFGVNSSVHSYLIVKYADGDKVATTVGFYYMANALGRLVGTILSGALYSYVGDENDGLATCFGASVIFVAITTLITNWLDDNEGGLRCGSSQHCLGAEPLEQSPAEGDVEAVEENKVTGVEAVEEDKVAQMKKHDDPMPKPEEQL